MAVRLLVVACLVLLLLAGGVAWLQAGRPAGGASGTPAATLTVFTGSAQVTRSGSATAAVARGGDQLRPGDQVATGPGARAELAFPSGDLVRLDAGTVAVLGAAAARGGGEALQLRAGQAWIRNRSGGRVEVTAGDRSVIASRRGDELPVALAGPGSAAAAAASRWEALNRALDLDPSPDGPSALGAGTLLPGEESAAQQAVTVPQGGPAQDLYFSADWTAGNLELDVIDPDGAVFDRISGPQRPVRLAVPGARAGGWAYRVRQLEGGEEGDSWFVVISLLPH